MKNPKNFSLISGVLFLRLTFNKALTQMFACLHKNTIITLLLIHKLTNFSFQYICPAIYIYIVFSLIPRKVFLLCKSTSISCELSRTCVYIPVCLLFICTSECKETKSNRCNQIEILLQTDLRLRKYYKENTIFRHNYGFLGTSRY